ncbi:MAG: Os1348 family NHLP clan protein [Chloroflexi bacterium]|nr:Os1348 family NHLP clan protein [Chloroflexota bacterium]
MARIDDVLERLVIDAAFRARLASDPAGALAGYDLTADDLRLLSSQLDAAAGASGGVEARTSKAGLFGLLGGVDEVAEALATGGESAGSGDGSYLVAGVGHEAADARTPDAIESASLPGAEGEDFYTGWIELNSVTEGEEPGGAEALAGPPAASSGDATVAVVGDLNAFEFSDGALPAGVPAATGDGQVDAANYVVWRKTDGTAGADPADLVAPTGADPAGPSGSPVPTESISMNFEQIKVGYGPDDGAPADLVAPTGADAAVPSEEMSLNFEEIKMTYNPAAQGANPGGAGTDLLIGGQTGFDEPAAAPGGQGDQIEVDSFSPGTPPAAGGDASAAGWRPVVGDWDGDGEAPTGTVDKDETISIHGNRTEGKASDGMSDAGTLADGDDSEAQYGGLSQPIVTSFSHSGGGGGDPIGATPEGSGPTEVAGTPPAETAESVSFVFEKLEVTYDAEDQAPGGGLEAPAEASAQDSATVNPNEVGMIDQAIEFEGPPAEPDPSALASGGSQGDGDIDGRDFLAWQRSTGAADDAVLADVAITHEV